MPAPPDDSLPVAEPSASSSRTETEDAAAEMLDKFKQLKTDAAAEGADASDDDGESDDDEDEDEVDKQLEAVNGEGGDAGDKKKKKKKKKGKASKAVQKLKCVDTLPRTGWS